MTLLRRRPLHAVLMIGGLLLAGTQATAEAPAAVTAAMDQAGAGAEVVVVIPSMSGLSEKIAAFAADTGIDAVAPELADGMGAFKRQMGWLEGVDDDGSVVVAVTGIAEAIEGEVNNAADAQEPTAVLLVPVTDYDKFVAQLGGDAAAQTTAINFTSPDGVTDTGYAKKSGAYAVLSNTLETVQNYAPANRGQAAADAFGDLVTGYLSGGDSLVYIDVAAMADALNLALDKAEQEARAQMNGPDSQIPAAFASTVNAALELYLQSARDFVDGTDKSLLSLSFNDTGLGLTASNQMKDGSTLAGYFKPDAERHAPDGAAKILSRLPDQPYIYASAIDATAFGLAPLFDRLEAALGDDGEAGLLTLYLDTIGQFKQTNGVASVFYAPQPAAMMAGGFATTLTVYDVDDADAFVAAQRATFDKLAQTTIPLPATEPDGPEQSISFTTQYTEKALVIEGTDVHQFQVNTVLPPAMMQQLGPMAMVMGNAGTGGYIAAKDNRVLVTTVTDPQLITRGLQAVGETDGIGSAGPVAQLRDSALPPNPSGELYLSVAGIAETVNPFLPMFAPGSQPLVVPADLPPLAMGGASDGQSIALRLFVPEALVKFGLDTYFQYAPEPADGGGPNGGAPRAPRAF
ncbi:MAG: hypothetical protein AAFX76_06995 [Planctomycetota bacterium]